MLEQYAGTLFYGLLAAAFVIIVLLESVRPLRQPGTGLGGRWGTNIGLFLLDSVLLRTLQPIAAVAVAYYVEQRNWDLLSLSQAPLWLGIPISILIIDLGRYFEHVAFHQFKPLWRIHKVHHTDLDFDCTTGLRFHPLEALLGLGLDTLLIIVFGIPPLAIVIVALLYVTETLFNHANLQLPTRPERVLRWLIVTPDMHRVHHSALRQETDSNYSVLFSWWDRLFGTYCAQPRDGHENMQVGLEEFREPRHLHIGRMLWLPFQPGRAHAQGAVQNVRASKQHSSDTTIVGAHSPRSEPEGKAHP